MSIEHRGGLAKARVELKRRVETVMVTPFRVGRRKVDIYIVTLHGLQEGKGKDLHPTVVFLGHQPLNPLYWPKRVGQRIAIGLEAHQKNVERRQQARQ
jgi:hypothetical protein